MKRILFVIYSAMMVCEKKKKPDNWEERTWLYFNFIFFFFFCSIFTNINIYVFGLGKYSNIYIYGSLAIISFLIDKIFRKYILSIIRKNDPSINYKPNKTREILSLIIVITCYFLAFFGFIFSHKIQNYL